VFESSFYRGPIAKSILGNIALNCEYLNRVHLYCGGEHTNKVNYRPRKVICHARRRNQYRITKCCD
jgi:hypothetical protein